VKPPPDLTQAHAPGSPGIPARWTSSAKSGVGTALGAGSRVWFTLSHGILNEVYYPRVDSACTRDLGLIVTDGASYFSEEKRHTRSEVSLIAPGVPAFHLRNAAIDGRYLVDKDVLTDPSTDVVLQRVRFTPLQGTLEDYRVYALLAPHLNNRGAGNTAWLGDYKGVPVLYAERNGYALALTCSAPWLARSVGFVGSSDGWQQLRADGRIVDAYARAEDGNVAMTGEIDVAACLGTFVLALGFGGSAAEAGQRAASSLITGFDAIAAEYTRAWQRWHHERKAPAVSNPDARAFVAFSAAMLRVHESKAFRGGVIASLSVPWGFHNGDDDLGGYHLVWPRDLVETGGGFLAAGAHDDARRVLRFLQVTQNADGHWCQNMWLDGSPLWNGIQMDETALPVLLVDLAARAGALAPGHRKEYWPMIRRAASFIVRNGPVSPQDRWEEDPGYSPFTLAAEIAALLVAADDADANDDAHAGRYLRETADAWFASLDDWMYVTDTELSWRCGVDGYYVRVAAPDEADAASPKDGFVPVKNRPPSESTARAALTVSPDALALVRFGLREASDPRIMNTVKVIDAVLKVETPNGPAWRRYNGDGYGEHEDGSPFDGTGIGRPWPLLTGERAHWELAAGHADRAVELADAMRAFAGDSLLLPEQVWDAADIPGRELSCGGATGSARPLVWAHAEYIKLCRSIQEGRVFDRPPQTVERYLGADPPETRLAIWRFNNKIRSMAAGRILRIETRARVVVHAGIDGWSRAEDVEAVDTGLGMWVADLDTRALGVTHSLDFTLYWADEARWEGTNFHVVVTT
jgi:glucoamylase